MNLIAVLIALAIIIVAFKFNVFLGIAVAIVLGYRCGSI